MCFSMSERAGFLLSDLHSYDPATNSWEQHSGQAPAPRTSFGLASMNGLLYVFGGHTGEGL